MTHGTVLPRTTVELTPVSICDAVCLQVFGVICLLLHAAVMGRGLCHRCLERSSSSASHSVLMSQQSTSSTTPALSTAAQQSI